MAPGTRDNLTAVAAEPYWPVLKQRFSMNCPRCVQQVTPEGASCPHCGYSLQAACALYGAEAVVVERLMDVEGVMSQEEQESVRTALLKFEQLFPQLFLLMYLGPLPPPASPRQFAFWLLNHAAVADADAFRPNERGLLLVVDPRAGAAVLSGGYFIEHLLRQDDLDRVLRAAFRDLGRGDFPAALRSLLSSLVPLLRRRAQEASKRPPPRPPVILTEAFPPLVRTGEVAVVPDAGPEPGEENKDGTLPAAAQRAETPVPEPAPGLAPPDQKPVKTASGSAAKRAKPRRR